MNQQSPVWVTNDPVIARRLREADKRFWAARAAAADFPLARKVEAFRLAAERRREDYQQAIRPECVAGD